MDQFAAEETQIEFEEANLKNSAAKWKVKMEIAADYLKFIVGRQGETKRRIESQTKTEIQIPRINQHGPTCKQLFKS